MSNRASYLRATEYTCHQPAFDDEGPIEWAMVKGDYVHVSQNGYLYKSGPYPSMEEAEMEIFRILADKF